MTGTLLVYSGLFTIFAYRVQPRNYLLFLCHNFNIVAQTYQLKRGIDYQHELVAKGEKRTSQFSPILFGAAVTGMTVAGLSVR